MVKALNVSTVTHQMLVRVGGELQAQLGKQLTFEGLLQVPVHEHDELGRRRLARPRPDPGL